MLRFVDFFSTRESSTWSIVDRLFDSDDLVRFVDTTFPSSKPNYTLISNGRKDGSVGFSTLDCEACDCSIFLFHLVRASHARVDIFSSHSLLSTDPLVGRIDDVGSRDSSFSFASFVDWIRGVGISIGSSLDGGCTGDVHPYRVRLGGYGVQVGFYGWHREKQGRRARPYHPIVSIPNQLCDLSHLIRRI